MREIKFRAWHENVEIMSSYQEDETGYKCFQFLEDDGYQASSDYSLDAALESKDIILMQYTGLKDKNGVEIYEGDVVKQTVGKHYWVYEVMSLGGQFGNMLFAMTRKNNCTVDEESDRYTFQEQIVAGTSRNYVPSGKDCEIIGNIYQNPELLTQENAA